MQNLPAQKHIETIRDALWGGTGYGRASVMVGSGFSRNARPKTLAARPMPTWSGLTQYLYGRLNPTALADAASHKSAMIRSEATSEALRLADEFQATFGRQQLEDALLEIIPNNDYHPGDLHRHLLRLPWADVLTTNYDTLLERAAQDIHERRYDVVERVSDIPRASRPRIVKLHGSFPSHRPFIISAEDFRTYPQMFAGFVNLAQQTAMETVLCLLGFSGDDPNFLQWTGWVRDHLGTASPRIFLCGLLNLKDSGYLLLDRRNVTPVDLSPMFPTGQFPDPAIRHAFATEWLLLNLEAGQPYNPRSWPKPLKAAATSRGLPDLIPIARQSPVQEGWAKGDPDEKAILEVVNLWRRNREVYPGWIVPPRGVRSRLFDSISTWLRPIIKVSPKLEPVAQFNVLYELNWRLEACLCPVWSDLAPIIQTCLETFNPYPRDLGEWPNAKLVQGRDDLRNDDWASVRRRWFHLAVAMLRFYREERRSGDFHQLAERLERISDLIPEQIARVCYEKGLLALAYLDDETARAQLRVWPTTTSDPVWDLRRAALVAELGDVEQAEALAVGALTRLRLGSRLHPNHIPELSREGWAIVLIDGITFLHDHGEGEARNRRAERLQELESLECDPWSLLRAFDSVQLDNAPVVKKQGELRVGFQPDNITKSYSSNDIGSRLLAAYQIMRLTEEVGYPARCANVNLYAGRLKAAAQWFLNHDPVRTQSILCRLLDEKLIDRYLSRHRIAALSIESVSEFAEIALRAIRLALSSQATLDNDSPASSRVQGRIATAIGILSRVAIRLSPDRIGEMWPMAFDLYSSTFARSHIGLPKEIESLFASLVATSERAALEGHFATFVSLPIPASADFAVKLPNQWPELTTLIRDRLDSLKRKPSGAEWDLAKTRLFTIAGAEATIPKQRAVQRLLLLREYGCLSATEIKQLANLLWSSIDPSTYLPSGWPFFNWVWLTLPPPDGGSPVERFRDYAIGKGKTAREAEKLTRELLTDWLGATRQHSRLNPDDDRSYIEWTSENANQMFLWMRGWWSAIGRSIVPNHQRVGMAAWGAELSDGGHRAQFRQLITVLRWIIIPRVFRNAKIGREVVELVSDMEAHGVAIGEVIPALTLIDPKADSAGRLRTLLADPDQSQAIPALRGLLDWIVNQRKRGEPDNGTRLPPPPDDLLHELGYLVASRRWPGLDQVLEAVAVVLKKLTGKADPVFLRSVLIGLDYLFVETAYQITEGVEGAIPYDWVPRCRERAARVVVQLERHGHRDHPTVKKWLEVIGADPLPEIRFVDRTDSSGAPM